MTSPRRRVAQLLGRYWTLFAVAFLAMLVEAAASLAEPWPLKVIFDYVLDDKEPPRWLGHWLAGQANDLALVNVVALSVIAIALVGAVASYTQKYLSTTVGKKVGYDLRRILYHHVQRLSLAFYDERRTGDLVVRLTKDIDAAEDFISSAILGIVLSAITLLGMGAVMFYLDWRFSLIGLSIGPILFLVVYRFTRRIKRATRAVKSKESDLTSVVQESISSMRVVKAFAGEQYEEERLDRESRASVDLSLQARSIKAMLPPLVDILVAIGTGLVLWFGVRFVLAGELTTGALLVFVIYLGMMYKPMKDLSKLVGTWSDAEVGMERIAEILGVESHVQDLPGARPAPRFAGRIEFDRVSFGYDPRHPVLRDLSLSIEPGQRAALVGLTGCGKSTLVGLIARMYDVDSGRILIDGCDIRDFTLDSLRHRVSFVPQDTVLFHATIAHNIAYAEPTMDRERIVRAAALANADEFIVRMPDGYDTVVGERGETLSGGQRQRIAIARALVRDAPILLMDEPSAALDPRSEQLIFEGVNRLLAGRTSITIAHRIATVRGADVIFVLHEGRIAEQGTHQSLLALNGLYSQFYRMQFPSGSPEEAVSPATA